MDKHTKIVIFAWIMGFLVGVALTGGAGLTIESWLYVIFIVGLGATFGGILLSEIREIREMLEAEE